MPTLKHGAHLVNLTLAGVISTAVTDDFPYHAQAWTTEWSYDAAQEAFLAGSLVVGAGTYTNWTVLTVTHYNVAGSTVNAINLVGLTPTAHETADLTTRTATTGNTLMQGWFMNPGDSIELLGTCASAGPGVGVTLALGVPR